VRWNWKPVRDRVQRWVRRNPVSVAALAAAVVFYLIFHPHLTSAYRGTYVVEHFRTEQRIDRECLGHLQHEKSTSELIQRVAEDECTRTETVPDGPPSAPVELPDRYDSEDACSRAIWSAYQAMPDQTRLKVADCRLVSVIEWWWW
jgi:hypothetical protein